VLTLNSKRFFKREVNHGWPWISIFMEVCPAVARRPGRVGVPDRFGLPHSINDWWRAAGKSSLPSQTVSVQAQRPKGWNLG
jgi:hypothetical protein